MTNPNLDRPELTPELIERFAHYYWENPGWGSLHIVLDDDNIENGHVEFCWGHALASKDMEGWALAGILLSLTRTQRSKISRKVDEWLNRWWRLFLNMARATGAREMYRRNLVATTRADQLRVGLPD